MTFHFWGQEPWFALSIVVNVNCPAPTVSLNGQQCFSSQENCTDLFSAWLGAVSRTVSYESKSCPSYLSFSFFLLWATSTFSETVTKWWLLSWAVRLAGCSAELAFLWLIVRKGWENRSVWAVAEREAVAETEQRHHNGSSLLLQLEVDVKSSRHREIQNVCAVLFPRCLPMI